MESWEFYKQNPLNHRKITRIDELFSKRAYLFSLIGIPPVFLEGKKILEFGPGEGHNSIYAASLKPQKYALVDGDPHALEMAEKNIKEYAQSGLEIESYTQMFDQFETDERFDLIVAEACLSIQNSHPDRLLKHMATFVKKGGLLFITTLSPASYLSELFRRLTRNILISPSAPTDEQVKIIAPLIREHFSSLAGFSRTVEEWIIDNIVQPLDNREMLSLPDAINTLSDEFSFYSSSPRFSSDWKWYKSTTSGIEEQNPLALDNYYRSIINLIDYRVKDIYVEKDVGTEIDQLATHIWDLMMRAERQGEFQVDEFYQTSIKMEKLIQDYSPLTANAIREAAEWINDGAPQRQHKHFSQWWGRGQQFVSFMKR